MENEKTTEATDLPKSPYVGLIPYSDRDAKFFFGRETETEIISANLRSARLTVLYGTSGVGKSSVLQAGVVHNLRELAAEDVKTYGQAEFAVVTYRDWAGDPLEGIAGAVSKAVAVSLGIKAEILEPIPETDNLVKILQSWSQRYNMELLIILDQFEELFNYMTDKKSPCGVFADQLAEAVKTPDLSARFLISLRGDTLSLLDYFKETIPGLFENRLQLHHLSASNDLEKSNAHRAIKKPIDAYNKLYKPALPYEIETELVNEVIEQIKVGRNENTGENAALIDGVAQTPIVKDSSEIYVETPYLQLVMKRIWREEVEAGSNTLHLKTLTTKLGGTKEIIKTHLDGVLEKLTAEERQIASKCFKYLVTPMGTKIALTPAALAKYTERDENEIEAVLKLLIKGRETNQKSLDINLPVSEQEAAIINQLAEARILRNVEIPVGKNRLAGYEVSHDAYIPAILDWRERYVIEHNPLKQTIKYIKIAAPILAIIFSILVGLYFWLDMDYRDVIRKKDTVESELTNLKQQGSTANIASNEASENKVNKQETASSYEELISILVILSSSNSSAEERNSAIEKLKKLIAEEKVPKEYEDSIIKLVEKIDTQKANDLRIVASNVNTNRSTNSNKSANTQANKSEQQIKPRVYIHIVDESQREKAKSYGKLLENNGFIVPGIENVGNIRLTGTQIRYFRDKEDENLANKVKQLLESEIKNVRVQYVPGYEDSTTMRPKHLEIWFAADAFPDFTNQDKK